MATLAAILSHCTEEGACLVWQRAVNSCGAPIMRCKIARKCISVRRAVYRLRHGALPAHLFVSTECRNTRCLSCLVALTKRQYMRRAARSGRMSTPARCAARAREARARSRLTAETVARMRMDRAQGALLRELAERYGTSITNASRICVGRAWREAVHGASVFGWRR